MTRRKVADGAQIHKETQCWSRASASKWNSHDPLPPRVGATTPSSASPKKRALSPPSDVHFLTSLTRRPLILANSDLRATQTIDRKQRTCPIAAPTEPGPLVHPLFGCPSTTATITCSSSAHAMDRQRADVSRRPLNPAIRGTAGARERSPSFCHSVLSPYILQAQVMIPISIQYLYKHVNLHSASHVMIISP